jgi:hypothetical protein
VDSRQGDSTRRGLWTSYKIQSYILECYEGTETSATCLRPTRLFMWADTEGEVWIGNSVAFAEHLAERFFFAPKKYDYVSVNSILIDAGERVERYKQREQTGERTNQEPAAPTKRRVHTDA